MGAEYRAHRKATMVNKEQPSAPSTSSAAGSAVGIRWIGSKTNQVVERYLHFFFILIPALFYYFTACRTPGWVDATLIVSNAVNLRLGAWVNTHNLFSLLGYLWLKILPRANIHFNLVLLSAIFGTVTVYFVFLTGRELTSKPIAAAVGALVVMISHSLWWHSTMLEVYTLNAAIISIMLFLIVRFEKTEKVRYLYLAAFFFGLGCSNHVLMGLFIIAFLVLFVYILVRKKVFTVRRVLLFVLCFLFGISLYLYAFTRDVVRNARVLATYPDRTALQNGWRAFRDTLHGATGGDFKKHMFTKDMSQQKKRFWRGNYFILLIYNYLSPAVLMGFFGLYTFWKKKWRVTFYFFCAGILAQAVWSANYFIWDMYAFSMPVYVMFGIPVILTMDFLMNRSNVTRIILCALLPTFTLPLFIYPRLAVWYLKSDGIQRYFGNYPEIGWAVHTWDPIEYIANPAKRNYDKVERYVNKLFSILPEDAYLLNSDSRSDYPLQYYYRDYYGIRPDINHYALFSPFLTEQQGSGIARQIKRQIENGKDGYTSSVLYPEKVVLDQLLLLYDSNVDLTAVSSFSEAEYFSLFPGIRFEKIVMFEEEDIWIYKITASD